VWREYGVYAACGIVATMPRPGLCREYQDEPAQGPRNTWVLARQPLNKRHSSEALGSELFEEGQQLVVRLKTLWSSFHWIGFGQGLFFQRKVGIQIDLSGFH
jgi:hypothetical protein